jgi:hypothetical protein
MKKVNVKERLMLGREALGDNVLPSKDEAIFLYDLIQELEKVNEIIQYQVKKYESALEEITLVGYSEKFGGGWTYSGEFHAKCMNIAREALGEN